MSRFAGTEFPYRKLRIAVVSVAIASVVLTLAARFTHSAGEAAGLGAKVSTAKVQHRAVASTQWFEPAETPAYRIPAISLSLPPLREAPARAARPERSTYVRPPPCA